jgi:hypothetical protein
MAISVRPRTMYQARFSRVPSRECRARLPSGGRRAQMFQRHFSGCVSTTPAPHTSPLGNRRLTRTAAEAHPGSRPRCI